MNNRKRSRTNHWRNSCLQTSVEEPLVNTMSEALVEMLNALRVQIKEDTETSLKQVEENITHKINEKIEEKFCKVESDLNKVKITQENQEKRLDDFDRKLRQRNLIFFGISEEELSYSELEDLVLQLITLKMDIQIEKRDIEFVGRIGKKTQTLDLYG